MANYASAFQQGLTAYEQYAEAEREVGDAIAELSKQLGQVTNGRLSVRWTTLSRPQRGATLAERVAFIDPPHEQYRALEALGNGRHAEIARLEMDKDSGWPAT